MDLPYGDGLTEAFVREIFAHKNPPIDILLKADLTTLIGILGIMQLALRHPGLADSAAAKVFAQWAHEIEARLAEYGPAIARVCSMGWSPEHDVREG